MDPVILAKYEFKTVERVLDALQSQADHAIYSRESPLDQRPSNATGRTRALKDLENLLAPFPVNKRTIRVVLDNVHQNLLGIAKELLPVEGEEVLQTVAPKAKND